MTQKNYDEAYKYIKHMLHDFPFNPRLEPKITRISVATNQYEDLEEISSEHFPDLKDKFEKIVA